MTTHTLSERDRAIDRATKAEAECDRLRKINMDLLKALEDMTNRFERCLVTNGTLPEFAKIAVTLPRATIAEATKDRRVK